MIIETNLVSILNAPKSGIYSIKNIETKQIYLAQVESFVAWYSRECLDIQNGTHKLIDNPKGFVIELLDSPANIHVSNIIYAELIELYKSNGWIIAHNKINNKYKKKLQITFDDVRVRITNSNNKVIFEKKFKDIETANQFYKLPMIQILSECS